MPRDPQHLRVVKFGGSSFVELADYARVAAHLIELTGDGRTGVIAVVSGMSGSTGRLLEAALAVDPDLKPEVQDQALATAEMLSATLLRAALHAQGSTAIDLWAHQLGIVGDDTATRSRIVTIDPAPVLKALTEHQVVVLAGGQAVRPDGRITMLGRNSSDLTAVAIAGALGVTECEIYSDVPGVYTTDPYTEPAARLMPELSYAQCEAMSDSGAKVLFGGSVVAARRYGVAIACRSLSDDRGTVVGPGAGTTAVVGDRKAQVFRLATGVDPDQVATLMRETGLVAVAVPSAEPVLAFTGDQRGVAEALAGAGVMAEAVHGTGLMSVVEPDGTARRWLAPLDEVDAQVRREHARLYQQPGSTDPARLAPKARSANSGLLIGSAGHRPVNLPE
ncbi:hypothetical protein [Kitasatospora sp. NPDC057936]|uniref:amino acid kinase family protein n=1 Tax=Kitasatospora sp. NPDC057936 TaxID=3346283 RepID=UPI0036D95C53